MSTDQAIKWAFIGLIGVIDLLLLTICPLELHWGELVQPSICGSFLLVMSLYYHHRGVESLVVCMVALLQMGSYAVVISVFIYAVTTLNFPLADPFLMYLDSTIGFSSPALVDWTRSAPIIDSTLNWAYLFIVPVTMLTILAIAFLNRRVLLEQFMSQFMLGTAICGITGCFLPAIGPAYNQGVAPMDWQQNYIDHILSLRSGQTFAFSWQSTEGLVTFPSFHTAWAIMLAIVWRKQTRLLSAPIVLLSVLIIASTLTTGAHYFVDIVGGIALAGFCAWASHRITAFSYHSDGSPRRLIVPVLHLHRFKVTR